MASAPADVCKHRAPNAADENRAGPGLSLVGKQVKEDFPEELLFDRASERAWELQEVKGRKKQLTWVAQDALQGAPEVHCQRSTACY